MKKFILSLLVLAIASVGATFQKYSKNVYYFKTFKNRVEILEFLNTQEGLTFVQIYRTSDKDWELYYAIRTYFTKCVYGCEK